MCKMMWKLKSHENKVNQHLAIISSFFDGCPKKYILYYRNKIKVLSLVNSTHCSNKIHEYNNIIKFVIANIPPKIEWKSI